MTFLEPSGDLLLMTNACFTIETCKIGDSFLLDDLNFTCDADSEWAGARGHDFAIMMSDSQSGEPA